MEHLYVKADNLEEIIQKATTVLKAGGLVVYPTETLYGAGVDACNAPAVTKLLQLKKRPAGKAISVLVADSQKAAEIVEVNPEAEQIFQTLLPGPITVVCKDKGVVDNRLASEWKTLGIRISSHPVAAALANACVQAITATSANSAAAPRPYSVQRMLDYLTPAQKELIDLVIDVGELPKREPSTVIDTTSPVQTVVRAGSAVEQLAPPFISGSESATKEYADALLASFKHVIGEKTLVFALEGEMGMGKTRFAQGLGVALGVNRPVTSPSFTLIKEYRGETTRFIHIDLWRTSEVTPAEIGMDEYLTPDTVLAIEWPQPLLPYLQERQDEILVQRLLFKELPDGDRSISLVGL
jgi:L-threonylcarbamoyladenylate synthase